ncbi:MAG: bifunctional hydroxymethylpyrimidine kinase/phosphomethylpyrimidine kinase [Spirochaetes bacterium]|nr:bifunctional hydroxymethylpyrimidine kinase/phosphomethylpyrimidine kinase [Spirochaetota bacterium]
MKNLLIIAGFDPSGVSGIIADVKTAGLLKVNSMAVVTAVAVQGVGKFGRVIPLEPEIIKDEIDAILRDFSIDCVKVGMLYSKEIIEAVYGKLKSLDSAKVILDTPMISSSGGRLLLEQAAGFLAEKLFPAAELITPNIPEAEVFTNTRIKNTNDMKKAALILKDMGAKKVLIKGGHLAGNATDILYDGSEIREITGIRSAKDKVRGTGCVYSASVACYLARGNGLEKAVIDAKKLIRKLIETSRPAGDGFNIIQFQ